jgi:hypothetical protein
MMDCDKAGDTRVPYLVKEFDMVLSPCTDDPS